MRGTLALLRKTKPTADRGLRSLASNLWGNKKWEPPYEGQKGGNILVPNQLTRLQIVLFECPKYRNPSASSIFG